MRSKRNSKYDNLKLDCASVPRKEWHRIAPAGDYQFVIIGRPDIIERALELRKEALHKPIGPTRASSLERDRSVSRSLRTIACPPAFAEYLLWYLPREVRDDVMGDLEEEFHTIYDRFGRRKAVIWYYYQVGASFYPFAIAKVQKLIKLGVFAWVGEAFRRFIS